MLATIRSEFRKLLTIRSTYFITLTALLLVSFIAFWAMGYKSSMASEASNAIQLAILNCVTIIQVFGGIVAILLITHEYRYNTISYTLTASNSRMKVLFAKILVMTAYAVCLTAITAILVSVLVKLGSSAAHHTMVAQHLAYWEITWKSIVFVVSGILAALVFGFLARSVVFAIVAYFLIPTTVEPLLNGLLKVKASYLPFMSQSQIVTQGGTPGVFSPLASAGVFCAYLLGAWIIASILFVRRDAN